MPSILGAAMFFRIKKSGERAYVQIVENKRIEGAVRQSVIATLGRADELSASGALASLLASGAKLTDQVLLINALDEDIDGSLQRRRETDRRAAAVRQDYGSASGSTRFWTIS